MCFASIFESVPFFFPSRPYYALLLFVLNSFDANVVLTWFSGLLQQSWQQILLSP
jgi:hypothetical protein